MPVVFVPHGLNSEASGHAKSSQMARALRDIEEDIRKLDPDEQTELLRHLIAELDGTADPDVDKAWLSEAQRRYRELQENAVDPIPAEEVFRKLRSRLSR